jgi:hypothetical protein
MFEFNDFAMSFPNTVAEFAIYKRSEGGRLTPATGVILYKNGEKCVNNILKICSSEANVDNIAKIAVGISFTDAAEKGNHVFFLKEKESDLRVDYGDLSNGFLAEKRVVYNPLARNLFLILLLIIAVLIVWRILIRPMMYERFKIKMLYLIYPDTMKTLRIKGCTKVVCSRKKQSQSFINKFFTGTVAFVQNDFWEQDVEITPKDKKSVRVRPARGFTVTPSNTVVIGTDTDITNTNTKEIVKLKIN